MARQDFLNGGFTGKLGEVVGQRLRGKHYLRTYVVGANPQTPAQQANRGMFAKAMKLTAIAMNINGYNGEWDTSAMTEYNARVGTAKRRLQAGMSDEQSIPLHPDGWVPPVVLTIDYIRWVAGMLYLHSPNVVDLDVDDRTWKLVYTCYNRATNSTETGEYQCERIAGKTCFASELFYDVVPHYGDSFSFIVTTDDGGEEITSPQFTGVLARPDGGNRTYANTIAYTAGTGTTVTITTSKPTITDSKTKLALYYLYCTSVSSDIENEYHESLSLSPATGIINSFILYPASTNYASPSSVCGFIGCDVENDYEPTPYASAFCVFKDGTGRLENLGYPSPWEWYNWN